MEKNHQDQPQKLAVIRQNLLELQAYVSCAGDDVPADRRDYFLAKIRKQLARLEDIDRQNRFFSRLTAEQQEREKGPLVAGSDFEVAQLDDDLSFYRKLVQLLEGYFRQLSEDDSHFLGRFVGIMKLAELKKVYTGWQHQATSHEEAVGGLERAVVQVAKACRWQTLRKLGQDSATGAADVLASLNRGVDSANRKISRGIATVRLEEDRIRKITAWETTEAAAIEKLSEQESFANPGMDKILDTANAMSSIPHGAFLANRNYLWQARRTLQAQDVTQHSTVEGLPLLPPTMMEGGQW